MPSHTVGAERFDTSGHRVEDVDISVNVLSPSVYLHIAGQKRNQQFRTNLAGWLEIARLQIGELRFAACSAHLDVALNHFPGRAVHYRPVAASETAYCQCGEDATFYFMEVLGKPDMPEYPKGSFARSQQS